MPKRTAEEKEGLGVVFYKQGLSLRKVGRELGVTEVCVRNILERKNVKTRSISEALLKYPKVNFSGDAGERARIIGFLNDCGARYSHKQVRVNTSTTHPAQMKLFDDLFGRYGHVCKTPAYNKQYSYYQWSLQAYLNGSFNFLVKYKSNPMQFLAEIARDDYEFECIAGQTDAEGWIGH